VAKKKSTTSKTAKRNTAKHSTRKSTAASPTKRTATSKAKKTAKPERAAGTQRKATKAKTKTVKSTESKPAKPMRAAKATQKKTAKPKAEGARKSTLKAAGEGKPAAYTPEPKPAVRKKAASGAKAREREGRMSSATPPTALPKTRLNEKQLKQFRDLLLEKRSELLSDVRMLTKDALGKSRKDSAGDLSSMPIHMADIGSDNWEQDFTLGLIANERQLVREIDEALERIEQRTYGICLATHKPITVARLRAKPWAKYCIEYAEQLERRGY